MPRTLLGWTGIALVGVSYLAAAGQEPVSPTSLPASPHSALLNRYCVTCHNEKLRTADLMLDKMDVERISEGAAVWEKVVRKLTAGAMPPAGLPRPDKATYDSFRTYVESELDRVAEAKPNPGRPGIRRLNRAEYANVIRDLLALDIDAESLLPADDSDNGFDNMGAVLSVSPLLMERYLSAAGKISRLAVGDPAIPPDSETYNLPNLLTQEDRMSDALPFGSRGGIAIRHHFPLDGEYVIRIRLQRSVLAGIIIGLAESHQLDVRLDGERIKLFNVGGEYKGKREALYVDEGPEEYEYLSTADAGLEVRFSAKAGTRVVGVAFVGNATAEPEGVFRPRLPEFRFVHTGEHDAPYVGSVVVSGPYEAKGPGETPSRQRIFACRPASSTDEKPCAEKILSTLARRAYRRPVTQEDVQTLLSFYDAARSKGGFEAGIGMALQRMLVAPEFLFRIERDPADVSPDTAYRISELELASRLSFFLWSSIPDDELLDLAEKGKLRDASVLEHQVQRMLADSRSRALVNNFAGQWLYLRNLRLVFPDPHAFPDFDENLRDALQQETELFFESTLREDRSVLDLLAADYTFLNERLARHYGVPNIRGSHFRRVPLSDEQRRGLLGQGSILTVTSYANRTSPVLRGKWVLDNILGTPPPPPPPNVPDLAEGRTEDGRVLSVRQRMEQHRANPACASCHRQMDPLGFALENFDALGRWRTADGSASIDASGVLTDGTKFQGPAELREVLLGRPEQFVHTVAEKLLMYALGRGLEHYDAPAVRMILREAAPNDYRWSSVILGIVKSTPFQMRRSRES